MLQPALGQYRFLQTFGEELLADLDPGDAFTAAFPGGHHPAWILGHLTFSGLGAVKLLGGDHAGFDEAEARFGIGSEPAAAGDDFAATPRRLAGHPRPRRVRRLPHRGRPACPAQPAERMAAAFPTLGGMVAFLLSGHEAVHIGQLSSWRRARGGTRLL